MTTINMESYIVEYLKNMLIKQRTEIIGNISEDYNLDKEELINRYISPVDLLVNKAPNRSRSRSGIDWAVVVSKSELKKLKLPELKDICSDHDLLITGNKAKLIDRVWGINHADEAPKEVRKRRGRPPKNKAESKVEVVQEEESCELDPDKMPSIYINDDDGEVSETVQNGYEVYKLIRNSRFVFKETEDNFQYSGEIIDNKFVKNTTEEHPAELLALLGIGD
jgi:hypothetical protein